ncbi:MAG: hypothetical protein CMI02_12965 [Oceanospirillaceae bacterium]|nr:hypothetical protein [Oceanospirillaceae bacterium]MBT12931.1 hypothetical protein [Oceanospirillaceae bacterium]|tara:strand:+ start:35282 stop:35794 length:513 start_codon:yes stop_codon:yes gene_type:complete
MNPSIRSFESPGLFHFSLVVMALSFLLWILLRSISSIIDDAYETQVRATAMSLQRAVLGAREQWFVQGKPGVIPPPPHGPYALLMSAAGWPLDALAGDHNSAGAESLSRCQRLWQALLQDQTLTLQGQDIPQAESRDGQCIYRFPGVGDQGKNAEIEYTPSRGRINYFIR